MARRLLRWERMPAAETVSPSKTILLVEDDSGARFATTLFLEDEGFSVIPASTGADALLILTHMDPPDLIVLDLMLPLMSGWDVSAELAKDERLARVPVIIFRGSWTGARRPCCASSRKTVSRSRSVPTSCSLPCGVAWRWRQICNSLQCLDGVTLYFADHWGQSWDVVLLIQTRNNQSRTPSS